MPFTSEPHREALILELRDAFLGLAGAAPGGGAPAQAALFEARIRELHAALEAAGDSPGSLSACSSPQRGSAPGSGSSEQWAIHAVRPAVAPTDSAPAPASPRVLSPPAQRQLSSGPLKSALKRPASGSGSWAPARSGAKAATPAGQPQRPGSARLDGRVANLDCQPTGQARPGTAPNWQEGLPQQQLQAETLEEGSPAAQQAAPRCRWQADDGLAEYEALPAVHEEQARCGTPRAYQRDCLAKGQGLHGGSSCPGSPVLGSGCQLGLPHAGQPGPAVSPSSQAAAVQQAQGTPRQPPLQLPAGLPRPRSPRPASASQASSPARCPSGASAQLQAGSPSQVRMAAKRVLVFAGPSSVWCRPHARSLLHGRELTLCCAAVAVQWTPNLLARTGVGSARVLDSPLREGLAGVFRLLEREGRVAQVGGGPPEKQR